jgi:hypothetical protein
MVAAYIPPDNTMQVGAPYKSNLDGAIVAGARIAVAFLPQAQDTPNMTVKVLAGALMIGGVLTEVATQNTGTITAPPGNPRIDRVVLNPATGAISVVTGTPGASPAIPAIPADRLPICRFQLATSTTAIANSMIVDERVVAGSSSSAGATATITAGEALTDRDLIYQDVFNQRSGGADRWYKVDTDAVGPVFIGPRIGIALAAISSGASGTAQLRPGRVAGFSGLTAGAPVFASATAGGVTQTAPAIPATGTQNATRRIGYAASATEIDFDPEDDTIFTARNSAVAVDGTITVQHWADSGAREREQAAYLVQASTSAVVAGGTGTNIGDFTTNGGLAAIFDGNTNQGGDVGGLKTSTTSGYAGKTYSPTKRIAQAVVYGGNSLAGAAGYVAAINPTVTLVLRGKTGSAPSGRTDGTSLGSISFTDTGDESGNPRTIASSDTATAWDHVWIDFSHNGAANNCVIAEIQFTELTGAARDEPLTIGGSVANAAATDRVIVRYDDGSGSNPDTRTTFVNRTGATRDLAAEVVL